jgi:hypothetical protein
MTDRRQSLIAPPTLGGPLGDHPVQWSRRALDGRCRVPGTARGVPRRDLFLSSRSRKERQ